MSLSSQSVRQSAYFYLLILCVSLVSPDTGDGLEYVEIIFRHGDRSPHSLYPKDKNPESYWAEGLGKLTKLGRKQHYNLGKYFRKMYKNFITTNPEEIDVLSSDLDRCKKSALSNIASFYAPTEDWKFEETLDWQPIPISYIPNNQDKIWVEADCPRASLEQNKDLTSPKAQEINSHYKELFSDLSDKTGLSIKTYPEALRLYDTLKIEKKYHLRLPTLNAISWKQLDEIERKSSVWFFDSKQLLRLRTGPFIEKIVQDMMKKVKGEIPNKKVQIISAHEENVDLMMKALNVHNRKPLPYCSTLIFEMHRLRRRHFVRLLFMNSTEPEREIEKPHVLVLKGCTEFCPLEYFVSYTAPIIPKDWEAECRLHTSPSKNVSETGEMHKLEKRLDKIDENLKKIEKMLCCKN